MRLRILLTCRDPGAAEQIVAIARGLQASGACETGILAAGAAATLAHDSGLCQNIIEVAEPTAGALAARTDKAAEVDREIDFFKPHVLLAGLSTGDFGLDELALQRATLRGDILTAQYIDFWGEYQVLPGFPPHHLFLMDEISRNFLPQTQVARVSVVGSPKHETYAYMDWDNLEQQARATWSIPMDTWVLGYFAQSDHHMPGHDRSFREWLTALTSNEAVRDRCFLLIKPHPKYPEDVADLLTELAGTSLRHRVLAPRTSTVMALSICNAVFSSFSTVNIDFGCMLGKRGRQGIPVFLSNPETRRHLEGKLGPGFDQKIILNREFEFWEEGEMRNRLDRLCNELSNMPLPGAIGPSRKKDTKATGKILSLLLQELGGEQSGIPS